MQMAIKDIFLPLVGEPDAAAVAAIDKCVAVAGDLGARLTAMAIEEDVLVRPKVMISDDLDNTAAVEAVRSVTDARGLLKAFDAAATGSAFATSKGSAGSPRRIFPGILQHLRGSTIYRSCRSRPTMTGRKRLSSG
jgi:hypothetical protein